MRRNSKLTEGMWAGDLEDLVLPMISVDEYESKIDDSATVIGFYVNDKDAADDLNRFVQKSPFTLLDTEVSPAPDQHGNYFVFVEILINNHLGRNIADLLADVSPLVRIAKWQMSVRGIDGIQDFDADLIQKTLDKAKAEAQTQAVVDDAEKMTDALDDIVDASAKVEESVLAFLQDSDLLEASFARGTLFLAGGYTRLGFVVETLGREAEIIPTLREAVSLDVRAVAECERLRMMLGEGWIVLRSGRHMLVQREYDDTVLMLAAID